MAGMAEAFEEIARRIDLYETYADILQGTSTRLESLLPPDRVRRRRWNERLFIPLTSQLVDDLQSKGLDLSRPDALATRLSADHRTRIFEEFRAAASGFRLRFYSPDGASAVPTTPSQLPHDPIVESKP